MRAPFLALLLLFSMGCAQGQDSPRPIKLTPLPQTRVAIPPGQYSGISHVGGRQYVVVHDKASGGGIFSFTIPLDSLGGISTVLAAQLPANARGEKGLDNEDIVYVPERKSLFVVSETTQSIREYGLDGKPTGVQLEVPEMFDRKAIVPGKGFESLAYNAGTGLFWTTTEQPLQADSLYRLQSFSAATLKAGEQYLYRAEAPTVTPEAAESARAYVLGIPAITALDDGRLLVMEREVYVPQGLSAMLTESFSITSLFEVDPVRCKSPVLEKKKLLSFNTFSLNLADFEGMCLGPVLPDGQQVLMLLADSQDGMGGLIGEYLKVVLLEYD